MKSLFSFMLLGLMILASCTSDKTEEVAPLGSGPQTIQITLPMGLNTRAFDDTIMLANKPNVKNLTIYIATAQGVILNTMTATKSGSTWTTAGGLLTVESNPYKATISNVAATATQVYVIANATGLGTPSTLSAAKTLVSNVYTQQDNDNLLMTGVSGSADKTNPAIWKFNVPIAHKVARFQVMEVKLSTEDATEPLQSFRVKHIYVNQFYPSYNISTEKEEGTLFNRWTYDASNNIVDNSPVSLPAGSLDLKDLDINKIPANWANTVQKCYAYHFFPATGAAADNAANQPQMVIAIDNIVFKASANLTALATTDVRYLVIKKYKNGTTSLTKFDPATIYNLTIPVAAKNLNIDPNAPKVTIECTVTVRPWSSVNIEPDFN